VSLLVFHFANGLWTAAITWGLTISIPAQRRWGAVCAALGVGLMVMAWASIYGAMTLDPSEAVYAERAVHEKKDGELPKPPKFVGELNLEWPGFETSPMPEDPTASAAGSQ